MDEFNYLSVLVSIILGLGITQLLTGIGRLIQARQRVRWFVPSVGWVGLLLLIHIQTWWAMFALRHQSHWNFVGFVVVLLHPITLYLLAALVLPEMSTDGAVDLRANYFAHARWFFSLTMAVVVISLLRPVALQQGLRLNLDAGIQLVLLALAGGGAAIRREGYHVVLVVTTAIILCGYIGTLFVTLN